MNSKSLTQAHVQAAGILTQLYSNLKDNQVLLFQMSSAIWRKVSACHLPQFCMPLPLHTCRLQAALLQAALLQDVLLQTALCKLPSINCPVSHLHGVS